MKNQIIIYPPIKVSPEEKKLIDSGAIELMSATVRDSKSKQIVRQLPVANKQYRTQNQNVGKLIGFGVVIGVAAFALTLALVNRYKKI